MKFDTSQKKQSITVNLTGAYVQKVKWDAKLYNTGACEVLINCHLGRITNQHFEK